MNLQLIPESAPFNSEQRAWLNGFLAGMIGMFDDQQARGGSSAAMATAASLLTPPSGVESNNLLQNFLIPHRPGFGEKGPEGDRNGLEVSSNIDGDSLNQEESFPWHDSTMPIVERLKLADGKPIERRMMAAMAQLDCGSCGYLCRTYAEAIANGAEKNLTLCSPGGTETAKMLKQLNKTRTAVLTGLSTEPPPLTAEKPGTRNRPVEAKWLQSRPLNQPGSVKDTRHVEIDLTGTGLGYQVGDALGVWPSNCDDLVQSVIAAVGLHPMDLIAIDGGPTLADELKHRCLRSIPVELVERAIESVRQRPKHNGAVALDATLIEELSTFADSDELDSYDVLEFFERFPKLGLSANALVETLSPIRPRLYSIASSPSLHPNQVHLTVGRVENEVRGRRRKGVASTMFSDRVQYQTLLKVFIQPSYGFTIPADPRAPMIMVGPGTGIAPFIAFLQQRMHDQATGRNWLFFGDQRSQFDFLYQEQLEAWLKNGPLTRLDLAFSRDGAEKLYVQHRMKENGAELFQWLEEGGYFFVCGDASRMAKDVDLALCEIVAIHGQKTIEQAKQYLANLTQTKHYVRDVY